MLLPRKGGIHQKRFDAEYRSLFLYPTYEHQRRELIKPQFYADLERTLRDVPPPDALAVSYWAEAAELYKLREEEQVAALSPRFIWTEDYALRRLHWRPKQPPHPDAGTHLLAAVFRLSAHSARVSRLLLLGGPAGGGALPTGSDFRAQ